MSEHTMSEHAMNAHTINKFKAEGFRGYKGEIVNGNAIKICGTLVEVLKGIRRYSEDSVDGIHLNYWGFKYENFETIEEAIEYMEDGTHDIDIDQRQVIFLADVMTEKVLDKMDADSLLTDIIEQQMVSNEDMYPCYGCNADYMFEALKARFIASIS